ncbi:MAG: hypothetical protein KDJ35_04110 [Alphaproteobacteria bacterium]|nr:hypothetical protein [Alphaproteobacteria bacterium]
MLSFLSNTQTQRAGERGSVLIIIFVAVALFAALSFTVADIMRSGDPNMMAEEQAKLFADELLNDAQNFRLAVQDMKISNGCADTDISFANNIIAGYEHTPEAPDTCKVFNAAGGGMNFIKPSADMFDPNFASVAPSFYERWVFVGNTLVTDIGTTAPELMATVSFLRLGICEAINDRAGVPNPPPVVNLGGFPLVFTGTYTSTTTLGTGAHSALANKPFSCLQLGNTLSAGSYVFNYALISR